MNESAQSARRGSGSATPLHRRLLSRWRGLDTDWKSVVVAAVLVAATVGREVSALV